MFRFVVFILLFSHCATTKPKPSREEQLFSQANGLAQDGMYREAEVIYQKILKLNPGAVSARRNMGIVQLKLNKFPQAKENLQASLKSFENNQEQHFYLAEAMRGSSEYKDAIFHYQLASKLKPDDGRTWKALAWTYYKVTWYSEAVEAISKVPPKEMDEQATIIKARSLLRLKRFKEAVNLVEAAEKGASANLKPFLLSVEGELYAAMDDDKKAEEKFRAALSEQPLIAGALLGLGRILVKQGKNEQGLEYMERSVRVMPRFYEAYFYIGKAYQDKNPKLAKTYFKKFVQLAAKEPEARALMEESKASVAKLQQ